MSIAQLRRTLTQATQDNRLDLAEARALVAAVGPSVSPSEARLLSDFYQRLTTVPQVNAPQVYATQGALAHLASFFQQVALPVGPNANAMTVQLRSAFEFADLGRSRPRAPGTSSLMELPLRDARAADGTRDTAFVNPSRRQVYLRVEGGTAQPAARWFGPFDLDNLPPSRVRQPLATQVTGALLTKARDSLLAALNAQPAFPLRTLPAGNFVELGVLLADGRGAFTVYLPDSPDLGSSEQCAVKRTLNGVDTFSALLPLQDAADPNTDGTLSPAMKVQARNIWFQLERSETWNFRSEGPPPSQRLVFARLGGSVPQGAFVVGRNADGSLKDPDTSSQVWFRAADGRWSGPHTITPLVP